MKNGDSPLYKKIAGTILLIEGRYKKMDIYLWITIGFIIVGFVVLTSMKKSMESKLAFIKSNNVDEGSLKQAKSIIWWIVGTTAWGTVSMILIVSWFHHHFGQVFYFSRK